MTDEEILDIVKDIRYRNWRLLINRFNGSCYLRVQFIDDTPSTQFGRIWHISHNATKSEVVQTAFFACLQAEEHEARERFRYRNVAVFSPHLDIDFLTNGGERTLDYRT